MIVALVVAVIVFMNWLLALSFAWWCLAEREKYKAEAEELRRVHHQ